VRFACTLTPPENYYAHVCVLTADITVASIVDIHGLQLCITYRQSHSLIFRSHQSYNEHTMNRNTKNKILPTLQRKEHSASPVYSVNIPKHLRSKQTPFDLRHNRGLAHGRHRESRVHNRDSCSAEQIGMARLTGVSSRSLSRCGALSQGHADVNNCDHII
jgi:hypothetical protein